MINENTPEYSDEHDSLARKWGKCSMSGEVCGYLGCLVPPERFCTCTMTYCTKHFKSHLEHYPLHSVDIIWENETA